jgi:hypothetical protein
VRADRRFEAAPPILLLPGPPRLLARGHHQHFRHLPPRGGIIYNLDAEQLHELNNGLCDFGSTLFWVVRPDERALLKPTTNKPVGYSKKISNIFFSFCDEISNNFNWWLVMSHVGLDGCFLNIHYRRQLLCGVSKALGNV